MEEENMTNAVIEKESMDIIAEEIDNICKLVYSIGNDAIYERKQFDNIIKKQQAKSQREEERTATGAA
jgi:hypothetical protein